MVVDTKVGRRVSITCVVKKDKYMNTCDVQE